MAWTSGNSNGCLIAFASGKLEGLDLFVIFLPPIQTLLRIKYIPFTATALPCGSSIPSRKIHPPPPRGPLTMPGQIRAQSNLQQGLHESDLFLGPLISFCVVVVHIVLLRFSLPSGSALALRG